MILSVKNEKELADLWVYLKQFGADGKKNNSMIALQPLEETIMRTVATVIVVLLSCSSMTTVARAEPTNPCKECRDQQQACAKNYSAKTCKTEYDICMKSCKRK
jgi:hypothetical protein